jgi:hypothetical protein
VQPYVVEIGLIIRSNIAMKNSLLIICLTIITNFAWSQCDGFEVVITLQNPTCHGFSDGSVNMTASGGNSPYNYILADTAGTIIDCPDGIGNVLTDGCYVVTVTDSLGCIETDTVYLVDPDPITVDLIITDPTYPGACDGIVIADMVYGYQGAYESIGYFWTIPGAPAGNEVTDICSGEYNLTINDEYGCSAAFDFALGSLAELPIIAKEDFEVFTNRQNGVLIVKNNVVNRAGIKLLNLAGQVVFESEINSGNVAFTPNLKHGVYLYTIRSNQGLIQTGKLVF